MKNYKTSAIILSRRNFKEADKILTIFTLDHGKVSVLAKGIRKINSRRAPHLEVFNEVDLVLHKSKSLDIITESRVLNDFSLMRKELKLVGYAFYCTEIVEKMLPEGQSHEPVYGSLRELFATIGASLKPEEKVKEFSIRLLWELGFLPHGEYPKQGVTNFIESVVEKKINSKKFLDEI